MSKVLVIDDNPLQLRIREKILRDAGLDVATAHNADLALRLLHVSAQGGEQIGAVVTDHIMPDVSGAEFVRDLRKIHGTVPVIVVSGMAEAEDEYNGLNVVFRQKPVPPPELIALVRDALKRAA